MYYRRLSHVEIYLRHFLHLTASPLLLPPPKYSSDPTTSLSPHRLLLFPLLFLRVDIVEGVGWEELKHLELLEALPGLLLVELELLEVPPQPNQTLWQGYR